VSKSLSGISLAKVCSVMFERLKQYITEMVELGLIEDEISLKLTEKGKSYIREYERVLDFMKRMGLTYQ